MGNAWGLLKSVPTRTAPLLAIHGESLTYFYDLGPRTLNRGFIAHVIEHIGNPIRQLPHLGLFEAARRHGGRTDAQSAADGRRTRIVRYRVLVDRHVRAPQRRIGIFAGNVLIDEIEQEQVIVRAPGYD